MGTKPQPRQQRLKDRRTRSEPHRVPISRELKTILQALPRIGDYVFPNSKSGKPLSNMAMLTLLKKLNRDASGKPRWVDPKSNRPITPHGFRATFRTWGEDTGFPRDLLEESLGHQIGNVVERAYRRTDSFDRRGNIMQAWATFCTEKRARTPLSPAMLKIVR
jgi:integrase